MCLLTRQKEPEILEEDMIVWKLMTSIDDNICSAFTGLLGS